MTASVADVSAAEVFAVRTPLPVNEIVQTTKGSYVRLGEELFRLDACETPEGVCLSSAPLDNGPIDAPDGALPDGKVALADDGDIRNAWFDRPTSRYRHGVLGDAIEGGSLKIVTERGTRHEFVLPENQVFEDITPRIRDLDGDGRNEVIAIRASQTGGAALALYGMRDGELTELAVSSENGRPNRWLNVAGIVEGGAGGPAAVYAVRTPHIGGRLFSITWDGTRLVEENDIATDLSNHVIGSRDLGLSAVGDFGGGEEIVLPSQDRKRLRFPLSDRPDIDLTLVVDKAIVLIEGRIVTASEDGLLLVVVP
ncbi:hypothetical protein [Oricola sp.]|uniref:hypothetical protein n=1 Tax=Oricola sp. TaxID=1979950 RepID=UPI003BAD45C2